MTEHVSVPTSLLDEITASRVIPAGTTVYLFGSWLKDSASANDVDVLLVYPDGHLNEAHAFAYSIRNTSAPEFFDVLALGIAEERELAFVESERAIQIWPVTTSPGGRPPISLAR
jgi:predicted nucleotidyltransferase